MVVNASITVRNYQQPTLNMRITEAIVRHMQEGSSSSTYNVIATCHQEACPNAR